MSEPRYIVESTLKSRQGYWRNMGDRLTLVEALDFARALNESDTVKDVRVTLVHVVYDSREMSTGSIQK